MTAPAVPPPDRAGTYRLCFVCTGNICRSPMAAVVMGLVAARTPLGGRTPLAGRTSANGGSGGTDSAAVPTLADRLEISSAGTGPWHDGEPMDPRARTALAVRGYPPDGHVARQVVAARLPEMDLLVALDRRHQQTLRSLGGPALPPDRVVLLRSFDPDAGGAVDVPDPYYGDEADFARCLAQVEAACRGLARALATSLGG